MRENHLHDLARDLRFEIRRGIRERRWCDHAWEVLEIWERVVIGGETLDARRRHVADALERRGMFGR